MGVKYMVGGFYVDYDDIYEDISYNDVYEKVRKADYSAHAIYDITPFQAAMIITFRGTEMRRREIHVSTLSDEQFSVKALENKMGQYGLLRYFDDEKCYISWCLPNSELVGMYLFYTSEYGSVEVDDGVFYHKFFRKDDLDELGVKYND